MIFTTKRAAVGLLVTCCLLVSADAAPAQDAANAADVYRQAFEAVELDDAQSKAIAEAGRDGVLTPAARAAVAGNAEALALLKRGAAIKPVDWGLKAEEGLDAEMPWLQEARVLGSLAGVAVRVAAIEGRSDDAVALVAANLALARHVGTDPAVVLELVQVGIESLTSRAAAVVLPRLPAAQLLDLTAALDTPDDGTSLPQAIRGEGQMMAAAFQKMPRFPNDFFRSISGQAERNFTPQQQRQWADEKQRKVWTDGYAKIYADMADAANLPADRRDARAAAIIDGRSDYGPIADLLTPNLDRAFAARDRGDAELALLKAAIDVQLNGEAALSKHDSPLLGGVPTLARDGEGYTLTSKATFRGEPATLVVGR